MEETTQHQKVSPGFLDTIIIFLVSAGLVLFLLWAASRTRGNVSFENLPDWLRSMFKEVWIAVATGASGIGLAIVRVLTSRNAPRPNYYLYIGVTTLGMLLLISVLPALFKNQEDHRVYVERELSPGGWMPNSKLLHPTGGVYCGQPKMNLPGELNVSVGESSSFNWDASYICKLQGVQGGVDGTVSWGTPKNDQNKLPNDPPSYGEWGIAKFKYLQAGDYTVGISMSAVCIDVNAPTPNTCTSSGEFKVHVKDIPK